MFGGNVSPANSPHPRKSANRSKVSDLGIEFHHLKVHKYVTVCMKSLVVNFFNSSKILSGTGDAGSSAEEYILRSVESYDIKGVTSPLTSVAIMPSPILLWRLKVSVT